MCRLSYCYRSGIIDMNSIADEQSGSASVEESVFQTAKLSLASSSEPETDVKASCSESAKKTEIPMPSGPKTRQVPMNVCLILLFFAILRVVEQ